MNIIKWYTDTAWHKWWVEKVWKPSWTKFTSAVYGVPAAMVAVGQYASQVLNDNTIQSYLSYFSIPNWVPMSLAGLALLYYFASGHGNK